MFVCEKAQQLPSVHSDRIAGRDRYHRCAHWPCYCPPCWQPARRQEGFSASTIWKQIIWVRPTHESSNGTFPPLFMNATDPTNPNLSVADASPFLRLLPYLEQVAAYAAYNTSFAAVDVSNLTVSCSGISTLQCPSDSSSTPSRLRVNRWHQLDHLCVEARLLFGAATWYLESTAHKLRGRLRGVSSRHVDGRDLPAIRRRTRNFGHLVIDGMSNTVAFNENTVAWLPQAYRSANGVINDGWDLPNIGVTNAFAPNPTRYMVTTNNFTASDSRCLSVEFNTLCGVNRCFADWSVKFIKDTISSWPMNGQDGGPYGPRPFVDLAFSSSDVTSLIPLGVWQKQGTARRRYHCADD